MYQVTSPNFFEPLFFFKVKYDGSGILLFLFYRCLYEIFSCARYLAGQGDIASGNMVAVMTKQDLKATSLPDIVKQLINKCTKEGKNVLEH